MARLADPELTKAFSELQIKIIEMNQKVKISEGQIAALTRNIGRCELTKKELKELPKDTNAYQSIGRMYMLEPIDIVLEDLERQKSESQQKIKTIDEQISYWKKGVKETEENIRDMVSQRRLK